MYVLTASGRVFSRWLCVLLEAKAEGRNTTVLPSTNVYISRSGLAAALARFSYQRYGRSGGSVALSNMRIWRRELMGGISFPSGSVLCVQFGLACSRSAPGTIPTHDNSSGTSMKVTVSRNDQQHLGMKHTVQS